MPELKYFKTIQKNDLADVGSWSDDWTPDQDIVIKRIYLKNKDGSAFTDSTLYLEVAGVPYTHALVPVAILGPDREVSPELGITVKAHQKIAWTFKNNEGATVSLFLSFECFTI